MYVLEQSHYYNSPVGTLKIVADDDGLLSVRPTLARPSHNRTENKHIQDAIDWLDAYFKGDFKRKIPKISVKITNTQWDLTKIPAGKTKTYGEIKTQNHARAYGRACKTNPLYIFIPCHRIISANGKQQYGGGIDMKLWLLNHEGAKIR